MLGGAGLQGRLFEASPGEFIGTSASGPTGPGFVFRLSLNDLNHAPVALDSSTTTVEDTAVTGQMTATDADGDALTFSIVTNGGLGSAVVTNPATGAFTYTPAPNAFGTDTFTFTASDGNTISGVAEVTVTIAPVNDAPVASDSFVSTPEGTPMTGTLVASDIDSAVLT